MHLFSALIYIIALAVSISTFLLIVWLAYDQSIDSLKRVHKIKRKVVRSQGLKISVSIRGVSLVDLRDLIIWLHSHRVSYNFDNKDLEIVLGSIEVKIKNPKMELSIPSRKIEKLAKIIPFPKR